MFLTAGKAFCSLCLLFVMVPLTYARAIAQDHHMGLPSITNFTIEQYKASSNSWSVVQDTLGMMYFANHFGVLRFDGANWQLIAQPENKTLIRSLAIDNSGKIYVGCQNDFGYLQKKENGQVVYVSLLPIVPERYRNFADVWSIHTTHNYVFFHSNDHIFCYNGEEIVTLNSLNYFQFLANIHGGIYALDEGRGLYRIRDMQLELLPDGEIFAPYHIKFLLPYPGGQLFVGTENDGLFIYDGTRLKPWNQKENDFFKRNKVSSGILLRDGNYAIGTVHNGLMIINKDGELLIHLNNEKGLQDNLILFVFEDHMGNLWVSSDIGIDLVEIASPFSFLKGSIGISGSVYSVCSFKNRYFVGSNKGLYSAILKGESPLGHFLDKFEIFGNLSLPTWSLSVFDEELIVGNHRGTFKVKDEKLYQLTHVGGWTYQPLAKNDSFLLGGLYNGLHLFAKSDNGWQYDRKIKGFNESSRIIEQEADGTIWMAHGYKGVFRIELNEDLDSVENVRLYDKNKGFPSDLFISVFKIRGEILFGTEEGVYYYDEQADTMLLHGFYAKIFGSNDHVRKLAEGPEQQVWFIIGEEYKDQTGVLKINHDGTYRQIFTPFQRLHGKHVPGFENFYFSGEDVFIGSKDGIIRFDHSLQRNYLKPFSVVMHEVKVSSNDSLLYGTVFPYFYHGIQLNQNTEKSVERHNWFFPRIIRNMFWKETEPGQDGSGSDAFNVTLPFSLNAVNFNFSAPFYDEPDKTRYSFYLEGIDNDWTPWVSNNYKEYTSLPGGSYIFRVKAKNIYGVQSNTLSFPFIIKPPWFRTPIAYAAYAILIVSILMVFNKIKNTRFKIEKRKLRYSQIQEMRQQHAEKIRQKLEAENRINQINKEKLEGEIATNAMHLTRVNDKIISIRSKLVDLQEQSAGNLEKRLNSIIEEINNDLESEESWKDFLLYFNRSHQDLIHRLKEKYPELTSVDIKLCAFLRMNLSSKQIASLMNITTRGVEAARLRVRKKLKIGSETNLTDFILKF